MIKAKNNQAKSYFSYKNDDVDLVEIGQFLRDTLSFDYEVNREPYVLFDKMTGVYYSWTRQILDHYKGRYKIRNPDLVIVNRRNHKIALIIEIDGGIHTKKFFDTEERNQDYFLAGLPLLVIDKAEITTSIFDLVHKKVSERLGN